jgi:Holliday junction resolvase-like predicted endonuclease
VLYRSVDQAKQKELVAVARDYLRRVPGKPATRFDILSIYLEKGRSQPEITLFKNAFSMP